MNEGGVIMESTRFGTLPSLLRKQWVAILGVVFIVACLASPQAFGQMHAKYGPPPLAPLVNNVKDSVVNLSSTRTISTEGLLGPGSKLRQYFGDEFFERFFGNIPRELQTEALGSGFLIDNEGHILTNSHVIQNATEIKVTFLNKKTYDAKVVGTDPKTELALIQLIGENIELPLPARLGNSDAMEVGDWVMAVGNPFGLGNTVTQGIISATGRVIGAGPYDDFLQTDAAINPGNSGGPLFNMGGEVIGINTAIVAQGQGIGFAIPINMAKELLPQLKEGKIVRGWLGIAIQSVTPELQKFFGLKERQGVIVVQVLPDSPAEAAGIEQGDVILTLNGKPIEDANSFSLHVSEIKPGNQADLGILRNGKRITKTVTVGEMPEEVGKPSRFKVQEEKGRYGFTVQNLTGQLAESLGLGPNVTGVVVTEVQPGGAADNSGLQVGDVIQAVNRQPVTTVSDFRNVIKSQPKGRPLLLLIRRGENSFYIVIEPKEQNQ